MWGASVFPALVASTAVSGLFIAFYVLENCVKAQCPYKETPVPSVPLPRVNTVLVHAVFDREPWELATDSFLCIAKSQMACLATITFAWCSAACVLLLLLSLLCPNPRPEEVAAFRNSSVFSLLQQLVMLTYVIGVKGGFQVSSLPSWLCATPHSWVHAVAQHPSVVQLLSATNSCLFRTQYCAFYSGAPSSAPDNFNPCCHCEVKPFEKPARSIPSTC